MARIAGAGAELGGRGWGISPRHLSRALGLGGVVNFGFHPLESACNLADRRRQEENYEGNGPQNGLKWKK